MFLLVWVERLNWQYDGVCCVVGKTCWHLGDNKLGPSGLEIWDSLSPPRKHVLLVGLVLYFAVLVFGFPKVQAATPRVEPFC